MRADTKNYIAGDSYEENFRTDETNQIRGGVWKETAKSNG